MRVSPQPGRSGCTRRAPGSQPGPCSQGARSSCAPYLQVPAPFQTPNSPGAQRSRVAPFLKARSRRTLDAGGAGQGDLSRKPALEESWGQTCRALARLSVREGDGLWTLAPQHPNFAGRGVAPARPAHLLRPRALPFPSSPASGSAPAASVFPGVVAGCRAHCLIASLRVPGSLMCVAVCVTDGASGACEGTSVSVVLKGASTFV